MLINKAARPQGQLSVLPWRGDEGKGPKPPKMTQIPKFRIIPKTPRTISHLLTLPSLPGPSTKLCQPEDPEKEEKEGKISPVLCWQFPNSEFRGVSTGNNLKNPRICPHRLPKMLKTPPRGRRRRRTRPATESPWSSQIAPFSPQKKNPRKNKIPSGNERIWHRCWSRQSGIPTESNSSR